MGGELRHLADFAVWESVDRNLVNRVAIELRSAARDGFPFGAVGGRRDERSARWVAGLGAQRARAAAAKAPNDGSRTIGGIGVAVGPRDSTTNVAPSWNDVTWGTT